jgi:hypothetical protein
MNDIVNTDTSPESPDLLTAAALPKADPLEPVTPVALGDIVAAMRETLESERFADFETMLATQACLMNMTFNRFIMSELRSPDSPHGSGVDIALKAQRSVCVTLKTLQRLRADTSGKGTEGP